MQECERQEHNRYAPTRITKRDKGSFYSPAEPWVMPAPSSEKPEEREFAVDSGASMHMLSKKD